jgi:hypothetical protein
MQMAAKASAGKHTSMEVVSEKIREPGEKRHTLTQRYKARGYCEENPFGSQGSKSNESKIRKNLSDVPNCLNVQSFNMLNVPPAYGREQTTN